jgi:hypothetical protein
MNTCKKELLDCQIFSSRLPFILNLELYIAILISTLYNLIFIPNTHVSPSIEKPDRVLSLEIRLKIAIKTVEELSSLHSLEHQVIFKYMKSPQHK